MKFKNNIFLYLLPLIIFVFSFAYTPHEAEAALGVPTMDFITQIESALTTVEEIWSTVKESGLDYVAWGATDIVVQRMTDLISQKILTSTNSFIKDFDKELLNLQQKISDELGIEITGLNTCSFYPNFNANLSNSLRNNNRNNFKEKFRVSIECRLDDVIPGGDVQTFYGDYNQGGRDAFMRMAFYQNPYRITSAATTELKSRQKAGENKTTEEARWGKGFKPLRDAVTGLIKLPGSAVQGFLNDALSSPIRRSEQPDEFQEAVASFVGNYISNTISGAF